MNKMNASNDEGQLITFTPSVPSSGMRCPCCGIELRVTDQEGIEMDYCPQCRGIWLDRGELDKLIAQCVSYRRVETRLPASQSASADDGGTPELMIVETCDPARRKSYLYDLFHIDSLE